MHTVHSRKNWMCPAFSSPCLHFLRSYAAIGHGRDGIQKKVDEDLLEQTGDASDPNGIFRNAEKDLYLLDFQLIFH